MARLALVKDRTAAQNRQHLRHSPLLQRQSTARIAHIDTQIAQIDAAIAAILTTQPDLKEKILLSISGIGPATLRAFIIDMPELGLIEKAQAASLAGLAPIARDSGTMRGKRRANGGRAQV